MAIKLSCSYGKPLEEIGGEMFRYLEDWPDPHGVYFKHDGHKHIWIPRSNPFQEFITFAHEFHHATFAPDVVLAALTPIEISRWEGKASAFSAIAAMPLLEHLDEDSVREAFGVHFQHAAHYRILHFHKLGW